MIKQLLILIILLLSIGVCSAGEILKEDRGTVYIYGEIEHTVFMSVVNDEIANYNRTICINSTVIEGEINIAGAYDYELEYNFIADINDTTYISRILIIKQEIVSTSLLGGKVLNRTLTLDGVVIGNYETTTSFWGNTKRNTVYFCLLDREIRFGDEIVINESLAFTQLNYQDQQDYLSSISGFTISQSFINHKYISVGIEGTSLKLSGLTGIIYNSMDHFGRYGDSVQSAIYLPLVIIQTTFNFIFTFLSLIMSNWWYAILLLEIFCIIPALKYKSYSDMVGTYINMHIKIFIFMYENIILNVINLILRIIEIIRNMFRI